MNRNFRAAREFIRFCAAQNLHLPSWALVTVHFRRSSVDSQLPVYLGTTDILV